ncbi:MAG: acyl-CoA thioesterase [Gemmatimonadetes bacterium]|nr:acyl-CoA thioesterase [Gemmatimonadota bacterium]
MTGQPAPGFRFHHAVDVRFRDLDPMGHAHHTLPLVYLEEARAAYWREVVGRDGLQAIDYVMAEITVRFHQRIEYPMRLDVLLRTSRIGGKSFEQEFEVRSAESQALLSSGKSVSVMYDYPAGSSIAVPDDVRERIERYEHGDPTIDS